MGNFSSMVLSSLQAPKWLQTLLKKKKALTKNQLESEQWQYYVKCGHGFVGDISPFNTHENLLWFILKSCMIHNTYHLKLEKINPQTVANHILSPDRSFLEGILPEIQHHHQELI